MMAAEREVNDAALCPSYNKFSIYLFPDTNHVPLTLPTTLSSRYYAHLTDEEMKT